MISKTITAAAEVILMGQTNLTTTNLSTLRAHCVSAGIMCARSSFISVTLVFASYRSHCFHLPSECLISFRFSYVPAPPRTSANSTQTARRECYIRARRAMDCSESNGSGKKARLSSRGKKATHLTGNGKYCAAVLTPALFS